MDYQHIEALLTTINKKIDNLALLEINLKYCSDQTELLDSALAQAQGEMDRVTLNRENPYYQRRYADLKQLTDIAIPALSKHGLSVRQHIILLPNGTSVLCTRLCHESGQWAESRMRINPAQNDVQSLGSHLAYIKRLSYGSLVGVVTPDEDDDGQAVMVAAQDLIGKPKNYDPKKESFDCISKDELNEFYYELEGFDDLHRQILDDLKISKIAEMPKSKYRWAITRVREIKNKLLGK